MTEHILPPAEHQEALPPGPNEPKAKEISSFRKGWNKVLATLKSNKFVAPLAGVAVLALALVVFINVRSDIDDLTSEDIRRIFSPPENTSSNGLVQGTQTPTPPPSPSPTPVPDYSIRGNTQPSPSPTPVPPTPTISYYRNQALGFEIQISSLWNVNEAPDSVVFVNAQGQNILVQSFPVGSETLDTVYNQLATGSSANSVYRTTFKGVQAISFMAGSNQAVAVIYNGRLFYIMAPNLNSDPISTFTFIN